jgi:hypothetical protein
MIIETINTAEQKYNKQAGEKKISPEDENRYKKIYKKLAPLCHSDQRGFDELMKELNTANDKCDNGKGDCSDLLNMYEKFKDDKVKGNLVDKTA